MGFLPPRACLHSAGTSSALHKPNSRPESRGIRSAPICSSAAADCPDERICRRSWHETRRCRNRCSRRCALGRATPLATRRSGRIGLSLCGPPIRLRHDRARDSARRNAFQWARPSDISRLRAASPHAAAASAARPVKPSAFDAAATSRTWSPIATPPRGEAPLGANTPNGRFWIGKSQPGAFADSTQLRLCGSWVSSSGIGYFPLKCFLNPAHAAS